MYPFGHLHDQLSGLIIGLHLVISVDLKAVDWIMEYI